TPAGTLISTVSSARTRPSPWHLAQGWAITLPSPAQVGQGDTDTNCPNMERAARRTSPDPPHVPQVVGREPRAAPLPPHSAQRSYVRTLSFLVVPLATSARSSLSVTLRSWPRCSSGRPRPPPNSASKPPSPPKSRMNTLSASDRSKCANPKSPAPAPAPRRRPAAPYRSYVARFSGSRRTSYASVIS